MGFEEEQHPRDERGRFSVGAGLPAWVNKHMLPLTAEKQSGELAKWASAKTGERPGAIPRWGKGSATDPTVDVEDRRRRDREAYPRTKLPQPPRGTSDQARPNTPKESPFALMKGDEAQIQKLANSELMKSLDSNMHEQSRLKKEIEECRAKLSDLDKRQEELSRIRMKITDDDSHFIRKPSLLDKANVANPAKPVVGWGKIGEQYNRERNANEQLLAPEWQAKYDAARAAGDKFDAGWSNDPRSKTLGEPAHQNLRANAMQDAREKVPNIKLHVQQRPLTSWSDKADVADTFGGVYVLKSQVPIERVFSNYRLFKNTYDENEHVVLGATDIPTKLQRKGTKS